MPRKPKKQAPQPEVNKNNFDEFVDDAETSDDDVPNVEITAPPGKSRDWRDVEKLREERLLRQLIDDDLDIE
jgi:hypothetical protein